VRSFADLPAHIAGLTREHERVAVILIDAFGWEFVQRHSDHRLLKRMEIEPLRSQFPSTTTAHLTTLYSGLPVEQHGLYEWKVYEPLLDDVIIPLRFVSAGAGTEIGLDPHEIVPAPTLFEQIDVPSKVLQPAHIWPSTYSSAALSGAKVVPFRDLVTGVLQLGSPGLSYLYWDAVDAAGHEHGPSSKQFEAAAKHALDTIDKALPQDTLLVVTADHGQIDVDAERLDLLDEIWPELSGHLQHGPAGSARDCFLHVDDPDLVARELGERLGDRASVHRATELFGDVGPRLAARLGDICVLPAPGRMAWLASHPSHERRFRGHHGGRTEAEATTWIGTLQTE
jgi:predicted AlkP superfamily pyrophosphatase or phosphodiesterase